MTNVLVTKVVANGLKTETSAASKTKARPWEEGPRRESVARMYLLLNNRWCFRCSLPRKWVEQAVVPKAWTALIALHVSFQRGHGLALGWVACRNEDRLAGSLESR